MVKRQIAAIQKFVTCGVFWNCNDALNWFKIFCLFIFCRKCWWTPPKLFYSLCYKFKTDVARWWRRGQSLTYNIKVLSSIPRQLKGKCKKNQKLWKTSQKFKIKSVLWFEKSLNISVAGHVARSIWSHWFSPLLAQGTFSWWGHSYCKLVGNLQISKI